MSDGIFALAGVLIAGVIQIYQKQKDNKHALEIKRIEIAIDVEKNHLLEPVLSYLDRDLAAMQKVYNATFLEKKDWDLLKIDKSHLSELPSIEARIKGIGNPELSDKFREFSHKRIKIANKVAQESLKGDPYEELKEGIDIARDIMQGLFYRLKTMKSE